MTLIPELQQLVSNGKARNTAGEQLAHLTKDEQQALVSVKGEALENTTVQEAKDYRKEASTASQTNIDFAEYLKKLEKKTS